MFPHRQSSTFVGELRQYGVKMWCMEQERFWVFFNSKPNGKFYTINARQSMRYDGKGKCQDPSQRAEQILTQRATQKGVNTPRVADIQPTTLSPHNLIGKLYISGEEPKNSHDAFLLNCVTQKPHKSGGYQHGGG